MNEHEVLGILNLQQVQGALSKFKSECEALVGLKATDRTDDQKARMKTLLGTPDQTVKGLVELYTGKLEELKQQAAEETRFQEVTNSLKSYFDTPGEGENPHGQTTATIDQHSAQVGVKSGKLVVESVDDPNLSIGTIVLRSQQFQAAKSLLNSSGFSVTLTEEDIKKYGGRSGLKTLMTTAAGYIPPKIRDQGQVPIVGRPQSVIDLVKITGGAPQSLTWMQMTTRTDTAQAAAEGGAGGESAFVWTEKSSTPVNIQAFMPVTEQQLEAEPELVSIIDQLHRDGLRIEEERQILLGNSSATPKQFGGILTLTGILTEPVGGTAASEKIIKGAKRVRTAAGSYAMPNAVLLHPDDMETVLLEKDTQQQYKLVHPLINTNIDFRYKPVECLALTAATGLIGDFNQCEIRRCNEIKVDFGWVNNQFTQYQKTVRIRVLEHFIVKYENAFCKILFAAS